jgi:exosortase
VPLATLATFCAGHVCNAIGVEVLWKGNTIWSAKGAFQFEIAEACSGIRSLVALGMVTAIYAYLTETRQWKRWAIFLASLPLAVLGNIVRVTTIMLVAQAFGQEVAGGLYHDYSSFIFFPVALLGMVVFAAMLNLDYQQIWRRLMSRSSNPSPPPSAPSESPI